MEARALNLVARRESNLNDVAVGLLASRFAVPFEPTGRTGSDTVQLWDTSTGELLLVLPGQGQSDTQQLAFSLDGNLLVARQQGEGTRLFDATPARK